MDNQALLSTINAYFEGLNEQNIDKIKIAFLPEAKLFRLDNGQLVQYSQTVFHQMILDTDKQGKENKILAYDVTDNIASVKVEVLYPDAHYIDYLSCMHIDGTWKIVNKIYCDLSR